MLLDAQLHLTSSVQKGDHLYHAVLCHQNKFFFHATVASGLFIRNNYIKKNDNQVISNL